MSVESILAKCGLKPDDVTRIASKHSRPRLRDVVTVADENEHKYSSVKDVREDYCERRFGDTYRKIASGADNGDCTTRRGTYRKLKTGDGRCATESELRIRRERDAMHKHGKEVK